MLCHILIDKGLREVNITKKEGYEYGYFVFGPQADIDVTEKASITNFYPEVLETMKLA